MDMHQGSPSGQATNPDDQNKLDEERKKLDSDLKEGKITQAEYFKKMQELSSGQPNPTPSMGGPSPTPQPVIPGSAGVHPPLPQLPPAGVHPGFAGTGPVQPVTPGPAGPGPREEVPPIGQALAISSEDVEVVECYKCGGLITITTKQRPVIIACPACGTKGEVDASEPGELEPGPAAAPKPTDAQELDEQKIFKFSKEDEHPKVPQFGSTLDEDLKKQDASAPQPTPQPTSTPQPTPSPQPTVQPAVSGTTDQNLTPQKVKKPI